MYVWMGPEPKSAKNLGNPVELLDVLYTCEATITLNYFTVTRYYTNSLVKQGARKVVLRRSLCKGGDITIS